MKDKIFKILKIINCFYKYLFYKCYCKIKRINNNDIWLISERGVDARDNGYHFYKYIKANHQDINVKYVISKKSADINKINKEDVIYYGSKEHYILFITAGVLISTHIMGYSPDTSLFWRLDKKGLIKLSGKKVFLQHDVIYNYLKGLQSKDTNLDLFITSAQKEYNFIKKEFDYSDKVLKCTGLPRYDKLINNQKNQILLMPTFRKWLTYEDSFENTEYYEKWNGLLNNQELIEYIEKNDINLYFYPHYEMQKYIDKFVVKSKNIIIASFEKYDVQKLLIESKLLITDYSSIFFDFAYMNKPMIYYQFDLNEFQKNHYQKGYFDYQKNGFGPVCYREADVIAAIKDNNYKKYETRIKNFFKYNDFKNSERVYNEIKGIEGR